MPSGLLIPEGSGPGSHARKDIWRLLRVNYRMLKDAQKDRQEEARYDLSVTVFLPGHRGGI